MTYEEIKKSAPKSRRYKDCPRCGQRCRSRAKMCKPCWHKHLKQPTTRRQLECFKLWINLQGNMKAVAQALGLACKTVEYHLTGLKHRLKLHTYVELVCWGFRNHIIE